MIDNIDHDEMEYSRWDLIENITEDLLVLMEEQGVTKTELAEALLTGKSNITQALNGTRNMTLKHCLTFALRLVRAQRLTCTASKPTKRFHF